MKQAVVATVPGGDFRASKEPGVGLELGRESGNEYSFTHFSQHRPLEFQKLKVDAG
ncbi:MAG: hypothetical protein IPM02_25325 [Betaproteobacteria bacterium]|nr:hypothetical protein [Betaproteobacteria bacterium]